jgi:hypothetical protein
MNDDRGFATRNTDSHNDSQHTHACINCAKKIMNDDKGFATRNTDSHNDSQHIHACINCAAKKIMNNNRRPALRNASAAQVADLFVCSSAARDVTGSNQEHPLDPTNHPVYKNRFYRRPSIIALRQSCHYVISHPATDMSKSLAQQRRTCAHGSRINREP